MKKQLIAAAVLAATAATASAADIKLYGRVDVGFSGNYNSYVATLPNGHKEHQDTHSFKMDSGNTTGSRFGLTGTEDQGKGYKVGFVLEQGFSADSGNASNAGRAFHRESSVNVQTPFGTVYAGRLNSLIADAGSIGVYGDLISPFGTGWGNNAGHAEVFVAQYRFNNTVAYASPKLGAAQFFLQYSMGDGNENESSTDRYYAAAAMVDLGKLQLGFLVDYLNKNSVYDKAKFGNVDVDDTITLNAGATYDCGFAKSYLAAQYFKNASNVGDNNELISEFVDGFGLLPGGVTIDGWGVNAGVAFPLLGGNYKLSVGFSKGDAEYNGTDIGDVKIFSVLTGWTYNISKRTSTYVGASYAQHKLDIDPLGLSVKSKNAQAASDFLKWATTDEGALAKWKEWGFEMA